MTEIASLRARPDDLDTVAVWLEREWGPHHDAGPGRTHSDCLRAEFLDHGARMPACFLALEGDRPVGTASLTEQDGLAAPWDRVAPWLANVYVVPAARGRGIASLLVAHVSGVARGLGHERLHLHTPDRQSLYRRHGFRDAGRSVYGGTAVDVMRLDLSP